MKSIIPQPISSTSNPSPFQRLLPPKFQISHSEISTVQPNHHGASLMEIKQQRMLHATAFLEKAIFKGHWQFCCFFSNLFSQYNNLEFAYYKQRFFIKKSVKNYINQRKCFNSNFSIFDLYGIFLFHFCYSFRKIHKFINALTKLTFKIDINLPVIK